MSGPVPSPSMNGMIGLSGTERTPSLLIVIAAPDAGFGKSAMGFREISERSECGKEGRGFASLSHRTALLADVARPTDPRAERIISRFNPETGRYDSRHMMDAL